MWFVSLLEIFQLGGKGKQYSQQFSLHAFGLVSQSRSQQPTYISFPPVNIWTATVNWASYTVFLLTLILNHHHCIKHSVSCVTSCVTTLRRLPLWSSGQSYWLQTQRSQVRFWCYQILWVAVALEQGPLSLVSINENLLERKWPRDTPLSTKFGT
jgi:hypothetical protein